MTADKAPVRYAVIGVGGVGQHHLRFARLHPQVELKAIVDADADLLAGVSAEAGVRKFTDYRDLLAADLVDAVSIATPHFLLGRIGLDCLRAGVHIFVEKPFATSTSQADAMIAEARDRKLTICVAYQYRTYRTARAIKQQIDSGALGRLQRVLWTWLEFRSQRYYRDGNWHADWARAGGGVLMNQASHDLDLMCWLVGQPVRATAMLANQLHTSEVEDIACAVVQFEQGALATFQASINQPGGFSVRQLTGDRGSLVVQDVRSLTRDTEDDILVGRFADSLTDINARQQHDHEQPAVNWERLGKSARGLALRRRLQRWPAYRWLRARLQQTPLVRPWAPSGHRVLMDSFIHAVRTGEEPLVNGESARVTLELINAIQLSALRGKCVDLPLDRGEYDALVRDLVSGAAQVPVKR